MTFGGHSFDRFGLGSADKLQNPTLRTIRVAIKLTSDRLTLKGQFLDGLE
jgi:hypothetical protein